MAEACRFGNHNIESKTSNNQDENFCIFHVLCVFISLVTILADLTTGVYLCNSFYELIITFILCYC